MNAKCKQTDQLLHKAAGDLTGPQYELCAAIIEFLLSDRAKPLRHITYKTLVNEVGLEDENPQNQVYLIYVTDYLSSGKLHLLDIQFQFIDPQTDEPIPIDSDTLSYALDSGNFYHPENGALIHNFKRYIFPFFTPSAELSQLHD
ncbi:MULTISPECIES: hypothetical protein [Yersinia]|uniref:hypothetical protein n=1 Tax=Yersinia TaxID=629 RepID=UPI0025AB132B|nr:hypothetical protein [Yersinia mollaretii]EKN5029785.1 hypothetical protein [Yersinia enterocolitica]MDN0109610.1 hypothetical protein [Yersinia mollaretii]HDL7594797.1 hypothetical protein [Yersinia enterocolitica]HEN3477577.1 hypothetical protein [Yersinia enterocolitica]HEN3478329.1 hypothetical protein [Yersinia enterocolitica]